MTAQPPDAIVGAHPTGVPPRALALSLAALTVPLVASATFPAWVEREGALLIWLPALLPAFLLTYHRGWRGASLALTGAMATLALAQAEIILLDLATPSWTSVFGIVALIVTVSLGVGWVTELLHRERAAAESSALTDALTGLPNRRHASILLEAGWAGAQRGRGFAVVLFDLDRFKAVNDEYGHAAGDRVLREVGGVLRDRTRSMDLAARFGGEEFLAVLMGADAEVAATYAEQIRREVSKLDFGWGGITLSAGVAAVEPGMGSPDVLVAAADRALYAAKERGRDRVQRADQALTPLDAPQAPPRATRARDDIRGIHALVVDDDPATLRATCRLLEHLDFRVHGADSGRAALRTLKKTPEIEVLVTDIIMPEMSGFTLVDLASKLRPDLAVLYISGYPQEEVYWGGTPGFRSAFLGKPMQLGDLEAQLRKLLEANDRPGGPEAATPPKPSSAPGSEPESTTAPSATVPGPTGEARDATRAGRLLIVDDNPDVADALRRLFERAGYEAPLVVTDPHQVRPTLMERDIDLILLDLHMPEMDGFDIMEAIQPLLEPEDYLPVLMLTGDSDPAIRRRALAAGAMDFLNKPFDPTEAEARVANLLDTRFLTQRVAHERDRLEERVAVRTAELADTRTEILHRLARAAEYRDDITGRHAERVGLLSSLIGSELGMDIRTVDLFRRTAPLHDVGKIGVPDSILRKPGRLTATEFELMKTHTTIGAEILGGSDRKLLQVAGAIALGHHERWDGEGYPRALGGTDIPIEARIVSVADSFDTLTHDRPYREATPPAEAVEEILRCRETMYDPDVVDAFQRICRRVGADDLPALMDPIDPNRDIISAPRAANEPTPEPEPSADD